MQYSIRYNNTRNKVSKPCVYIIVSGNGSRIQQFIIIMTHNYSERVDKKLVFSRLFRKIRLLQEPLRFSLYIVSRENIRTVANF